MSEQHPSSSESKTEILPWRLELPSYMLDKKFKKLSLNASIHGLPLTPDLEISCLCYLLRANLRNFRINGKYCDVLIRVQNKSFECHRVMLAAASEYFDSMFDSRMKESSTCEVTLHDVDEEAFEQILKFIYLEDELRVKVTRDSVYSIFHISDYLTISKIEKYCVDFILRYKDLFKIEDVLKIFLHACRANKSELIKPLHELIVKRFPEFSQDNLFLEMPVEELIQLMSDFKSLVSVDCDYLAFKWNYGTLLLLDILVQWICHSFLERRNHLDKITEIIDFESIPKEDIEFMGMELKFDSSALAESLGNKSLFKTHLRKSITGMNERNVGNIFSKYQDIKVLKSVPIQVYVQIPGRSIHTFSINKSKCTWSSTLKRPISAGEKYDYRNDYFQCFSLDDEYIYWLKFCADLRKQAFYAGSSIDISAEMRKLNPPPFTLGATDVCQISSKNLYFYALEETERDNILRYNKELDKWFPLPLTRRVKNASFTADQNLLYLIGGKPATGYTNGPLRCVQAFDYRFQNWFEISPVFFPYFNAACCTLNGKIYIFNGFSMEVLDPKAGKWEKIIDDARLKNHPFSYRQKMLVYEDRLWHFAQNNDDHHVVSTYDTKSGNRFESMLLQKAIEAECGEFFSVKNILKYRYPKIKEGVFAV